MKVILNSTGDLVRQARVARLAIDAGPPEPIHGRQWRIYGAELDRERFFVRYNKASITVIQQREAAE